MNYNEIVDGLVNNFVNPCDAQVGLGQYRRVKWELYNPNGLQKNPANQEEWTTEIIARETHVFTRNLLGQKSQEFVEPPPSTGNDGTTVTPTGLWSTKLGIYFTNQQALTDYVASIGATLLDGNNWYGADLSKKALFKTSFEENMYLIENCGGIWTQSGPQIDPRTMLNVDSNYNLSINYNGTTDHRIAYMKYYEDKPCAFTGIVLNTNVDLGIPGTPVAEPSIIGELPEEIVTARSMGAAVALTGCIPFSAKFPYNGLTNAILEAWNTSRHSFKLYWDMLPGMPKNSEGIYATAYNHLSVAMEELGNSAIAMCQYVQQMAWKAFQQVISTALNIVGAGWDLLKSFLPKITIMGVSIDIEELCTSDDAVGYLRTQFAAIGGKVEDQIKAIYAAMGSAYDYAVERVKMTARDLVDALTDFYDWCWSMLLQAGVALCKLLADIAQIWSMPPIVPNPIWSVITAVKEMLRQIKPLDMIMDGTFPGFTAADVYQMVMTQVNIMIDAAYAKIEEYKKQALDIYNQIKAQAQAYQKQVVEFKQYLSGMAEKVTDTITAAKEAALAESKALLDQLNSKYQQIKDLISGERMSVSDVLQLALNEFKKLPIVAQMEQLLSLLGASLDDMMKVYTNAVTKAKSLYHEFTDGARAIKDLIKSMYNQICTLALSKVTQWINKLLSVLSLEIIFPPISICVPYLRAPS